MIYFDTGGSWTTIEAVAGDYGTALDDPWIQGTSGNDRLFGLAGDDTFIARAGNDYIAGGDGYDQANYDGNSNDFLFALNGDGTVTVTDTTSGEGIDILKDVEALYFAGDDQWMTVSTALGL